MPLPFIYPDRTKSSPHTYVYSNTFAFPDMTKSATMPLPKDLDYCLKQLNESWSMTQKLTVAKDR